MMRPIEEELPHPENGCQSLKLLAGTKGFTEEKCIVFFPENVKTKENITSQTFAIFYFNKFYHIYHEDTLKRARAIFEHAPFKSAQLSPTAHMKQGCCGATFMTIFIIAEKNLFICIFRRK